jgi:hypothetical protein
MAVSAWSTTAIGNATTLGIDIGEGCDAANINNAIRELMAEAKAKFDSLDTAIAGAATLAGSETFTNKTLTSPAINGATLNAATVVSDSGTIASNSAGFRGVPQNAQAGAYQLALSDDGKHVSNTTGGFTIPANASVAFPVGATIVLFNNSGSNQAIAITSDTLRWAGTASTGSRTLAQYGLATIVKVASTTWVISGAGVS